MLDFPTSHDAPQPVPITSSPPVLNLALDGRILCASSEACSLLGVDLAQLTGRAFADVAAPVHALDESEARRKLVAGELTCYLSQRTATRPDGSKLNLSVVFTLERAANTGQPVCVLAILEDRTPAEAALRDSEAARREMAQRLTTAQENERTRIARELHDDIGQSLAILRIQMMRAGRPVSGMPGKMHPNLPELSETLKNIAHKVSRLSHQLHSSELEYLGLALAVQSHCREFTEKFKIPVECRCETVPAELDRLLALSILRVIQEALHNASKYSQAKLIKVELTGSPSHLSLLIADDGVGFDLEEARLAAGLGLISMRERIKLNDGEYSLHSKPGEGTRITARVPLNPSEPSTNSL